MSTRLGRARAYASSRLERRMEVTVAIRRPLTQSLDENSGEVEVGRATSTSLVYSGVARLWTVDPGPAIFLGDSEPIETRSARISLPVDAATPRLDDTVEILTCPYDKDMVGRFGVVTAVDGGGQLRASRVLSIKGMFESRSWQP